MSAVHSHSRHYQRVHVDGRCDWIWVWEDVLLACDDRAVPGGRFCAQHEIQTQTQNADPN
jgi:hypothetical protein